MTSILVIAFITFCISILSVKCIGLCAYRMHAVVLPRENRWHTKPVALYGGVGIFIAFVLGILLIHFFTQQESMSFDMLSFFIGAGCIFIVGLIDDVVHIKPSTKLIGQIVAVSIPLAVGLVFQISPWSSLNIIITFIWFITIINAVNLLDNMDGLASGIVMIATGTLIVLSFLKYGTAIINYPLGISLIFFFSVFGFWLLNKYPAYIFMGDAGSLFLGYILAGIAIPNFFNFSFGRSSFIFSLLIPVTILSLPLFDTLFVTINRIIHGIPITTGGKDHSSHRLVGLGFSEKQAVRILCSIALVGSLIAVGYSIWPEYLIVFLLLYCILLIFIGVYLEKVKVYKEEESSDQKKWTPLITDILHKKHSAEIFLDFFLIIISYYASYIIRFEDDAGTYHSILLQSLPLCIASSLVSFFIVGVYRGMWRFITLRDIARIMIGIMGGVGMSVFLIAFFYRFQGYSRSIFFIYGILLLFLMVGSRVAFRVFDSIILRKKKNKKSTHVLVYGAGQGGRLLLEECRKNDRYESFKIVAFIDDDTKKDRLFLGGVKIYPLELFTLKLKQLERIDEVWISSQKINKEKIDSLRARLEEKSQSVTFKRFTVALDNFE